MILKFVAQLLLVFALTSTVLAGEPPKPPDKGPNELWVGVLAYYRKPDATEEKLKEYLGGLEGLDYILQPDNPEELFDKLIQTTKGGKKISYLIIAGHGGANSPHISLGRRALVDRDVDRDEIERELSKTLKLNELENELYDAPASKHIALRQEVESLLEKRKDCREKLARLNALRDVMADDGEILLLNCSAAATPGGQSMCRNLGRVLLGRGGGVLVASRNDIEIARMMNPGNSLRSFFRTGRWVSMGETWVLGDWLRMDIEEISEPYLFGAFHPSALILAKPGKDVQVSPTVDVWPDSGKLRYFWDDSAGGTENSSFTIPASQIAGGRQDVKVRVQDYKGRNASDTVTIRVQGVEIEGPKKLNQDESASLEAKYRPSHKDKGIKFSWQDLTEKKDLGQSRSCVFQSKRLGIHEVRVEAFSSDGKSLGHNSHTIKVVPLEESDTGNDLTGDRGPESADHSKLTISVPGQVLVGEIFNLEAKAPTSIEGIASYRWRVQRGQDVFYLEKFQLDPPPDAPDLTQAVPSDLNSGPAHPSYLADSRKVRFQDTLSGEAVFQVEALSSSGEILAASEKVPVIVRQLACEAKVPGNWTVSSSQNQIINLVRNSPYPGSFQVRWPGVGSDPVIGHSAEGIPRALYHLIDRNGLVDGFEGDVKGFCRRPGPTYLAKGTVLLVIDGEYNAFESDPAKKEAMYKDRETFHTEIESILSSLRFLPQQNIVTEKVPPVAQVSNKGSENAELLTEARQLASQGEFEEAVASVEQAAEANPEAAAPVKEEIASAVAVAAEAAIKERDFATAGQLLRLADRLAPSDPQVKLLSLKLADYQSRFAQIEQLAGELEQLVAGQRLQSALQKLRQMGDLQNRDPVLPGGVHPSWQRSEDLCNACLRDYNSFLDTYQAAQAKNFSSQDWQTVVTLCDQALSDWEHTPANERDIRGSRALALQRLDEQAEGVVQLKKLGAQATALMEQEKWREAIPLLDQMLALDPDFGDGQVWMARASARAMTADYRAAMSDLDDYLWRHPGNPDALSLKGNCLMALGEFKEAGDCLYHAGENEQDSLKKSRHYGQAGKAYLAAGESYLARSIFHAAQIYDPDNPDAAEGLAQLEQAESLQVRIDPPSHQLETGGQMRTVAHASGGQPPYSFEWFVASERTGESNQAKLWTFNTPGIMQVRVEVTDARGQKAEAVCPVTVSGTAILATEPLTLQMDPPRLNVSAGSRVSLQTRVGGGRPPYHYRWYIGQKDAGMKENCVAVALTINQSTTITAVVNDAEGKTAQASCPITVAGTVTTPSAQPGTKPSAPPNSGGEALDGVYTGTLGSQSADHFRANLTITVQGRQVSVRAQGVFGVNNHPMTLDFQGEIRSDGYFNIPGRGVLKRHGRADEPLTSQISGILANGKGQGVYDFNARSVIDDGTWTVQRR
jgi:tetratricopeptide (TPR) repeat protein